MPVSIPSFHLSTLESVSKSVLCYSFSYRTWQYLGYPIDQKLKGVACKLTWNHMVFLQDWHEFCILGEETDSETYVTCKQYYLTYWNLHEIIFNTLFFSWRIPKTILYWHILLSVALGHSGARNIKVAFVVSFYFR